MARLVYPETSTLSVCDCDFSIGNLGEADLSKWFSLERQHHAHPWSEQNLKSSLASHQCIGLWWEQELVGAAVLSFVVGEAELLLFVLHQRWRGKGVASSFLRNLMTASKLLAQTMFLEVREGNLPAIYLYESCGFNQIGCRDNYYPAAKGREAALIFAAEL